MEAEKQVPSRTGFGITAPSTTEGKVLVVIYGLLGCSATIIFFNLFLERVITIFGLPHAMAPPEENTQHQARGQRQPTRGRRRGKRGGGPLCIRSLSNCLLMLLGVCCTYSLFNALSVIIKRAELDPESADPSA
ncbi:unnamed protein product [Coregonus sp. 'balchen']|nr:unnamed protein product [Coregonus sp. 'balchen']